MIRSTGKAEYETSISSHAVTTREFLIKQSGLWF